MRARRFVIPAAVVLAATALATVVARQASGPKGPIVVGFVSTQRLLAETDVRNELAALQATQQQLNAGFRSRQAALETLRQQISAAPDAASRAKLQQQEQQGRSELEKETAQAASDVQAQQRQIQAALQARLKVVLDEVLKDRPIQMVVNQETAVVWSVPGTDLTSEVVARLNARAKGLP